MKPERIDEIEAVAPRLAFTPDVIATLSRWSDIAQDLMAASYERVTNEREYETAQRMAYTIGQAQRKAEIQLLGGYEKWRQYFQLKGFAINGLLDTVDNDGNPVHPGPNKGESVVIHDRFADAVVDTSAYDGYFMPSTGGTESSN